MCIRDSRDQRWRRAEDLAHEAAAHAAQPVAELMEVSIELQLSCESTECVGVLAVDRVEQLPENLSVGPDPRDRLGELANFLDVKLRRALVRASELPTDENAVLATEEAAHEPTSLEQLVLGEDRLEPLRVAGAERLDDGTECRLILSLIHIS